MTIVRLSPTDKIWRLFYFARTMMVRLEAKQREKLGKNESKGCEMLVVTKKAKEDGG